jgi:hypothetical protein
MRFAAVAAMVAVCSALVGNSPGDDAPRPPEPGEGWIDLMKPEVWKNVDPKWVFTDAVTLDPEQEKRLKAEPVSGGSIWVNGTGRLPNLYTKANYGDCEVHLEFLIAKNSNGGIKFHGVYEIQIYDSHGKSNLTGNGMGGVYPRADPKKGGYLDKGIPPKVNAAKPAGEWQTLDVVWKSPRFDEQGEKTESARIVRAVLNGQVIHEDQEVKTPTGSNWMRKETPTGSFMIQTDHGPIAIRNARIRPLK